MTCNVFKSVATQYEDANIQQLGYFSYHLDIAYFLFSFVIVLLPIVILLLNLQMYQKGTDASNYEKGSSWAVEVGGHLKVSSIMVENLNKNGQMLVEVSSCQICKFCF